jgi:hypothetical protein
MRWRMLFTLDGLVILILDGEPVAVGDDLSSVLSALGQINGQARLAPAS